MMDFFYFIKNLYTKDFKLIPHSKFKFYIKLLLYIFFGTNLRYFKQKAVTKFYVPNTIKPKSDIKKNSILIAAVNGLYIKDSNDEFTPIIENVGGFFGLEFYNGVYYAACYGSAHTKGCIYSFKIENNQIFDFKIVFRKKFQYFHGLKIINDHLFLIDSSWLLNHEIIHKFKIEDNGLRKISSYNLNDLLPKEFSKFCHVNSIFFYKNKIYLLFHNMTEYTKLNSEVLVFDKNFMFIEKYKFKENLNSAHDFIISNKGKVILDSNNSILYYNGLKTEVKNYFLRGYLEEDEKLFIGLSPKKKDNKTNTSMTNIAEFKVSNNKLDLIKILKYPFSPINSLLRIKK